MNRFGKSDGLRSTVTDDEFGGFRIIIPAARNWFLRLFLPVWLCGWSVGEVSAPILLISGKADAGAVLFLVIWLVFWTFGGMVVFLALAWNLAGREIVIFTENDLECRRAIGRFSRSKSFELASISNFRYSPAVYNPYAMGRGDMFRQLGLGGGTIAFDYEPLPRFESKTRRFGDGLSEIEARRLILTIRQRYKFPEGPDVEPLPVHQG